MISYIMARGLRRDSLPGVEFGNTMNYHIIAGCVNLRNASETLATNEIFLIRMVDLRNPSYTMGKDSIS